MRYQLLKAQARKKKYIKRLEKVRNEEDADGEISSDEEAEISNNLVGSLIKDKYIVIKYISRGTFCKVWLVYDMVTNNYYALKIQEDKDDETLVNEIKMLSLIQRENENSNICKMIDNFEVKIEGRIRKAILFELLGDSLSNLVYEENDDIINISIIRKIMISLLEGINILHQNNLVHCDLKLDNILLKENNSKTQKIIDNINKLEMHNSYNVILEQTINKTLQGVTKSKRKAMKKKIKKRVIKEIINENKNKIIENSSDINLVNTDNDVNLDDLKDIEQQNKYKIDIDINNIGIKILDLGNTEVVSYNNDDEIYTRCYRPPENIINGYYDTKSDIWATGCLLYELLVGESIFDFADCSKIDKDRLHLLQMFSLLGKMPKEMALESIYGEDYFDSKGRILKFKGIKERNLRDELTNRIKLDDEELDILEDFMKKMLEYNPVNRYSAEQLLKHKWITDYSENMNIEIDF